MTTSWAKPPVRSWMWPACLWAGAVAAPLQLLRGQEGTCARRARRVQNYIFPGFECYPARILEMRKPAPGMWAPCTGCDDVTPCRGFQGHPARILEARKTAPGT